MKTVEQLSTSQKEIPKTRNALEDKYKSEKSETKRLEQFEIATNQRLQGQLQRMQGQVARQVSRTQAVGTLLSGGSQAYATYKMA